MAKEAPYFYNIKLLNIIFALGSLVFMGMVIWTVLDDAERDWKHYQRTFKKIEYERAKTDLQAAKQSLDKNRYTELQSLLKKAKASALDKKSALSVAQKELDKITTRMAIMTSDFQIQKSLYDTAKYRFEETHAAKEKAEMEKYGLRVAKYTETNKEMEKAIAEAEARVDAAMASQQELQDQIKAQSKEVDKVAKKMNKVKPSLAGMLLDIPLLDFMAPTLTIKQILPEGLTDDYNFVKVPKVDRCTTCHVAIDKPGFETAKQPFTTHPQLDLYLGDKSPHAMDKYGCTSCHLGNGRGTSFYTAAHTPASPEQAKLWEKKHHWHPYKHWEWPMLPKSQMQANCISCHTGVMNVPKADKLNAARDLFAEMGCVGCHATAGFNDLRKVGPALTHIGDKVQNSWLPKWIENPKSFNPHTRMPQFFGLSNAPMDDRQQAIAGSMAAYLEDKSTPITGVKISAAGNARRGEALVKKVGCVGCHAVGDMRASAHGPDLNGTGSKMKKEWLMAWLKDPKKLFPHTKMPNMRLSDQETADIAEYLMTLKNPAFDALPQPLMQTAAVDALVLENLQRKMPLQDAEGQMAGMNAKQRQLLVGEAMIQFYGCFGCHDIGGLETARKIGAVLTEEGSKPESRFDFGFAPIEHTREAFFRQKLADPRAFDEGKVKAPLEKLKMPKFDLTPEQVDLLTLHLVSQTKHSVPMERQRLMNDQDMAVEQGRKLVRNFNCQGCHVLDGKGGNIAETLTDQGFAPPALEGEGKKVKGDWLFTFLKNPTPIRPWLHFRMPTFGFTDEEATTLTRYFQGKDSVAQPFHSLEKKHYDQEQWNVGKQMFEKLQCLQCHQGMEKSQKAPADLAPDLSMAPLRLREEWIAEWLTDPQVVQPGTRMPTYFPDGQSPLPTVLGGKTEDQIKALKTFVANFKLEK